MKGYGGKAVIRIKHFVLFVLLIVLLVTVTGPVRVFSDLSDQNVIKNEPIDRRTNMAPWILILLAVVGWVIGPLTGWYLQRLYSKRRLLIVLQRQYSIVPRDLGFEGHLGITYDGRSVDSLHVLILKVSNRGKRDMNFPIEPAARDAQGIKFPHMRFRGFEILGFHTLNNDPNKFYIPLVPLSAAMWLNIRNLKAGFTAEFLIVGLPRGEREIHAICDAGFMPDTEITVEGIIELRQ